MSWLSWQKELRIKKFRQKKFMTNKFHDKNFHDKKVHDKKLSWPDIFMTKNSLINTFFTKTFINKNFMTENLFDKKILWQKIFMAKFFWQKFSLHHVLRTDFQNWLVLYSGVQLCHCTAFLSFLMARTEDTTTAKGIWSKHMM